VNIAVDMPMLSPSVAITATVNVPERRRLRSDSRTFLQIVPMESLRLVVRHRPVRQPRQSVATSRHGCASRGFTGYQVLVIFINVTRIPAALLIGVWFLTQVVNAGSVAGVQTGGVAYVAHVAGAIFGMIAGRLFVVPEKVAT
jgi:hypothetical protein